MMLCRGAWRHFEASMVLDSTAKVSVPRCDLERELVETMLTKHLLTKTSWQDLQIRTCKRISQDRHRRTFQMILQDSVRPARACIEVTQGIFKDFMQGPLARISPGSPQDLLVKGHLADLTRSFYNSLPRACPKSFHGSTANTGHNDRDPTRTKRPPKTYKGTRGLSDLLMYFDQFLHAPRKVKVEHVKRHVFARFQPIFRRDLSSIAPETES